MRVMPVRIDPDRRHATIPFEGKAKPLRVDAGGLEALIQGLAGVRSEMVPAVPKDDPQRDARQRIGSCRRWYVMQDPDVPTCVRLCLLHPGIGWVWIPLRADQVAGMTEMMGQIVQTLPKVQ